jgi:hypothetical protein
MTLAVGYEEIALALFCTVLPIVIAGLSRRRKRRASGGSLKRLRMRR